MRRHGFRKSEAKKKKPEGLRENKKVAKSGGSVAKKARVAIEDQTGESIVNKENAKILIS